MNNYLKEQIQIDDANLFKGIIFQSNNLKRKMVVNNVFINLVFLDNKNLQLRTSYILYNFVCHFLLCQRQLDLNPCH